MVLTLCQASSVCAWVMFVTYLDFISVTDIEVAKSNSAFSSAHTLLMTLYDRDCRRSYTQPDHWLIKSVQI